MLNRTSVIIIAIAALLAGTTSATAETRASKEETVGVGSGAVIGAVAGGPVGFILGAAIGGKLGDTWHEKNQRIDTLGASLDESKDTVARLEGDIDELGGAIAELRDLAKPELIELMQAGIAMDLLFRTDEAALADATGDRLAQLAGTLASMPDIQIQLDGFADERGDEQYNLGLSEKRVAFVRDRFIAAGVQPARIRYAAHGESTAQDANPDSYALERRVSVKLFIEDTPSLASNPD